MVHLSPITTEQSADDTPEHQSETAEPVNKQAPNQSTKLPENLLHKNRLHEYAQKSGMALPIYQTVNEGVQHAPRFRSTVLVDGSYYTSPVTFSHRKAAEQEVANVAFNEMRRKIKHEAYPLIRKDTVFCKSILNEYAVKLNVEKPTYTTTQRTSSPPVFVSYLVFNGATYTGEEGGNKREAEQLAARVVVLSILGNSDTGTLISEIIKSKFKLYAVLSNVTDSNNTHNGFSYAAVNTETRSGFPLSKGKEVEVTGCASNMPCTSNPKTCLGQLNSIPATHQPFHEFKKPKLESSSKAITPAIVFVPAALELPLGVGSSSARKKNRKNKKAKKKSPV